MQKNELTQEHPTAPQPRGSESRTQPSQVCTFPWSSRARTRNESPQVPDRSRTTGTEILHHQAQSRCSAPATLIATHPHSSSQTGQGARAGHRRVSWALSTHTPHVQVSQQVRWERFPAVKPNRLRSLAGASIFPSCPPSWLTANT